MANTQRIENNATVSKYWYCSKNLKTLFPLLADNSLKLAKIYGRGRRHSVEGHWLYEFLVGFEGKMFHVYSGYRGTSFEVEWGGPPEMFRKDWRLGKLILRFLDHMKSQLVEEDAA